MAPAPSTQPNATDQTYASKVVTTSAPPPQSTPHSPSPPPPNSTSPPPVSPPPSSSSSPPPSPAPPPKGPPPPQFSPPPPAISTPPPAASPPPPSSSSSTPTPPSKSPPQSDWTPPQNSPSPPSPKPPPSIETPPAPQGGAPPLSPSRQGTPPLYPPPGNQLGSIPPSLSNPLIPFPTPPGNPSGGVPPSVSTPAVPAPTAAPPQNSPHFGINKLQIVGIAVGVSFLFLSLVGLVLWYLAKQKKRVANSASYVPPASYESSQASDLFHGKRLSPAPLLGNDSNAEPGSSPSEPGGLGNSRSWFTYQELEESTNGFSPENLLGEGGFGAVYKGCLADGRVVAVKQLKAGGGQGEREFRAEVETISRVHHRHLVSLVGYCISDHQRLLVYDYVPNNNLYEHLHDEGMPVMDWATRFRVAAGAARGIAYLHEDCHPRIIHRDIKSSNILLDNNFEARVSDFGLAKLALDAYTHITTRVMGTFGYLAPEYATSGKLTEKSDVYSFGVVLLELISGRKPVDASQPLGEESLVEWARPLLMHALDSLKFDELVDPRLENNYVEAEMFRMIEAAAACVRQSAAKRPRMGQVMIALDSLGYVSDLRNGMTPGQSGVYDNAQESAEIRLFRRMAFGSQDFSTDIFSTKGSQS